MEKAEQTLCNKIGEVSEMPSFTAKFTQLMWLRQTKANFEKKKNAKKIFSSEDFSHCLSVTYIAKNDSVSLMIICLL
jgi:hypothetical protein